MPSKGDTPIAVKNKSKISLPPLPHSVVGEGEGAGTLQAPLFHRAPRTQHTTCFAILLLLLIALVSIPSTPNLTAGEEAGTAPAWQVYFSPEGGCTQATVNAIKAARQQIMVQAYE